MKKLLSIIASVTVFTSSTVTLISCTANGPNQYHDNSDYNQEDSDQSVETKQAIEQAMEARIKAAVLTDVYHINKQQTQDVTFRYFSNNKNNLKTVYNTYFDEKSLIEKTSNKIDLNGNLGFEGGAISPIFNSINIPDFFKTILKNLTNIDLNAPDIKNQIIRIFNNIRDVLQGFSASAIAEKLPILIGLIPSGILDNIPNIIGNTLSDVSQAFIEAIANKTVVEPVLDALVKGSDLKRFSDSTIATLFDALFVNLTNFVGFAIDESYQELDDKTANFDQLGQYWYTNRKKLSEFSFTKNLPKTVEKLISTLAIFNTLLTIHKTPDNSLIDDERLFDSKVGNDTFIEDLQTKTLASFNFDLTKFHLGELISNAAYYLGQTDIFSQHRFQKFLYPILFNGDTSHDDSKIPSFWKFNFALIKANSESEDATINKNIANKMQALYHETLAPKFLSKILNNKSIVMPNIDDKEKDKTLWSIIDGDENDGTPATPGLKDLVDALGKTFSDEPMKEIYSGNLRPIVDSLTKLVDESSLDKVKEKINQLVGPNNPLNVTNLLNAKLSKILGVANVPGYPENEIGLIPDYPGYYTTRSLKELIIDLSQTFKMTGNETITDLTYYYLDFSIVKNLIVSLFYENGINEGKGLIADVVDALVKKEPLTTVLGYNPENFDEIKRTSFLGQLLTFFVPELSVIEADYINWETDLTGKQDNFNWIIDGALEILINLTKPVDYTNFITKILEIDSAFDIKVVSKIFSKKGNIKSIEYIIKYDLSAVGTALGYPNNLKTNTYQLSFNRNNEVDPYKFNEFIKI